MLLLWTTLCYTIFAMEQKDYSKLRFPHFQDAPPLSNWCERASLIKPGRLLGCRELHTILEKALPASNREQEIIQKIYLNTVESTEALNHFRNLQQERNLRVSALETMWPKED